MNLRILKTLHKWQLDKDENQMPRIHFSMTHKFRYKSGRSIGIIDDYKSNEGGNFHKYDKQRALQISPLYTSLIAAQILAHTKKGASYEMREKLTHFAKEIS